MEPINTSNSQDSILILTPSGRDAAMAAALFEKEGWSSRICPSFESLLDRIECLWGVLLIAEEALSMETVPLLIEVLSQQPDWSDIPIVLLTSGSSSTSSRPPLELFGGHGNITLLERPIRVLTLTSAIRASLRARRRQYQVRDLLEQREQARQEALEANRAKDQFLAALSHELRTPLTPVLMTVAALQQEPGLTHSIRADLDLIHRSVELEAKLIDDLLDLTRITRGKLVLHQEVADLHELVRHTIDLCCSPDTLQKSLRISVEMRAREHHVQCDPARVQQVLWNLVNNATKFTPVDGTVRISTFNPQPGCLEIAVADSGIGISKELLPKLFDAFEQGDSSITKHFGGLGLGLAITKAIVDLHDGSLSVRSEGKGKGSTFTLTFRTAPAPEDQQPLVPSRETPRLQPFRILLVEDHEPTRRVLSRLLVRAGHEVRCADSVAAAIGLADEYDFDLLVSDLGLPDGSGVELMQELSSRRHVDGIALSGYGMEEDMQLTAAAGFRAHLIKPVDWNRLEATLSSMRDGRVDASATQFR